MATGSPHLAIQALTEISKLLGKLTEDQLEALVKGEAVVEFRMMDDIVTSRPVKKAAAPKAAKRSLDLDQLVSEIKALPGEDAVERLLIERDKQLPLATMRALAEKIGPPVSTRGDKATLRKNIA